MNFLEFIKNDINAKKTFISTLPKTTKTQIKKYNENVESMLTKYNEYKASVRKYIEIKSNSFNIKSKEKDASSIESKIIDTEYAKKMFNTMNTFFEKIGFDELLYKIDNCNDFNFKSLNEMINEFLDKFALAGIKIEDSDFKYTSYVYEYMSEFIIERNKKDSNYEKLSQTFENIYWANPELIKHIELNFRKLCKKYRKDFDNYIDRTKKEITEKHGIKTYEDANEKLNALYLELDKIKEETVSDIIELSKNGKIDMNSYFEDSKMRQNLFNTIVINPIDFNNKDVSAKFYDTIYKLKKSLTEYTNYIKIIPLINAFKGEYSKEINNDKKDLDRNLKEIEKVIDDKENKLEKTNKKIYGSKFSIFESRNEEEIKQLKIDSVIQANELVKLYNDYEKEFFKVKILSNINKFSTISDLLKIYYSLDYFKKSSIKNTFKMEDYNSTIEFSKDINEFILEPNNVIMNSSSLFEEENIAKIIINRYRLENINLSEDAFTEDDVKALLSNIEMIIRINKIENSETTVDKIWFIGEVEKIKRTDQITN